MRIQNPAKHLRWSLLQKLLMAKSRIDKKRKEEREKTKERNFIILSLTLTWLVLIQLKTVDASWIMASILQLYWNQKKLFFFWNHIVPNHFGISLFQIVFWIYPISIKVFLFTDLVLVSVNYTSVSRCRFRPGQIERPRRIGHARVRKTSDRRLSFWEGTFSIVKNKKPLDLQVFCRIDKTMKKLQEITNTIMNTKDWS